MREHSNVWPLYVSTSVLGPDVAEHRKVQKLPTKTRLQFLSRMLPRQKRQKSTSFIVKPRVKEHCRTPKSTRITTKNENRRSWSAEKVRKFTDETRFRPFQEHRRTPESTRITTKKRTSKKFKSRKLRKFTDKTRARRSPPSRHYENSQTKRTCKHETTKIAMNSAQSPVRHLDLATPAFYYYRKNPKCYHTVWGIIKPELKESMGPVRSFKGDCSMLLSASSWSHLTASVHCSSHTRHATAVLELIEATWS